MFLSFFKSVCSPSTTNKVNYQSRIRASVSSYVPTYRSRVAIRVDTDSIRLFFQLSGSGSKATALKGQLFQPIVGRALQCIWDEHAEENRIRYLGRKSTAPYKVLKCQEGAMKLVPCDSRDEILGMLLDDSIDRLLVLENESFPVGDFIRKSPKGVSADYDVFQSTGSKDHNLTEEGLNMLMEYLPKREDGKDLTLRIFFCVPPHRFLKSTSKLAMERVYLQEQPICRSAKDTREGKCPKGLEIDQFSLEVDPTRLLPTAWGVPNLQVDTNQVVCTIMPSDT